MSQLIVEIPRSTSFALFGPNPPALLDLNASCLAFDMLLLKAADHLLAPIYSSRTVLLTDRDSALQVRFEDPLRKGTNEATEEARDEITVIMHRLTLLAHQILLEDKPLFQVEQRHRVAFWAV